MRPTSCASFDHKVAVEDLLRRYVFNFFSVFEFETSVDSLNEADRVAGATRALISHIVQKVESRNVPEVVVKRNLLVWNLAGVIVVFLVLLSLL